MNLSKRPQDARPYSILEATKGLCPACGNPIMKEEGKVAWRCTNFTCPAQAVTGITHFCSRSALDVESIGSSVAEALRSSGLASSALDLFLPDAGPARQPEPGHAGRTAPLRGEECPESSGRPAKRARASSGALAHRLRHSPGGEVVAKALADTHPDLKHVADSPYLRDIVRLDELVEQAAKTNPNTRENKRR